MANNLITFAVNVSLALAIKSLNLSRKSAISASLTDYKCNPLYLALNTAIVLMAGSAQAQMPGFDVYERDTGSSIEFVTPVQAIDFNRQMINLLDNDGNAQTYVYMLIPCERKDFVRMAIKDPKATGLPVFSYISTCFYDTASERFAQ